MDNYDDVDNLITDLEEDILSVSYGTLREEIINEIYDKIMYMYTLYDNSKPNRYEMGISGSYGDIDMIDVNIDITSKGIYIEGKNNAMGSDRNKDEYLDYYIEEGIYQYSKEKVPERPVTEWVLEELESKGIVEQILEYELKKRGWDIN